MSKFYEYYGQLIEKINVMEGKLSEKWKNLLVY
jgi:hypothetical protein